MASCGEFRVHPQKTRIAFITTMTFAGVKLARRWVDVSGRPLELVIVPLRSFVVERADGLALKVPRYAAEVFGARPAVLARIGRSRIVGEIEQARDEWRFVVSEGGLRELGLGVGDTLDLFVRADS